MRLPKMYMSMTSFYLLSLIIVVALYTKVNVESAILFIVSAGVSLAVSKCPCKSLLVSLLVVGLYIMNMNLIVGLKLSGKQLAAGGKSNATKNSVQKAKKL